MSSVLRTLPGNLTARNPANDAAPPIFTPAANPRKERRNNTNYARFEHIKDPKNSPLHSSGVAVHDITSQSQKDALDLIRWVFSLAHLPADSPRFNHYVSRWNVPAKIARAKKDGTFDALIEKCPPIDPAWLRLVPAALAEHQRFQAITTGKQPTAPASSGKPARKIKPNPAPALSVISMAR